MTTRALWFLGLLAACGDSTPTASPDAGAPPAPDAAATDPADAGAVDDSELRQFITERMAEAHVPGLAACIAKDGAVAWCAGLGAANLEHGVDVTPDTPFLVASVSKTITGAAVLKVWEGGAFELDDDINDATPFAVANPMHAGPVTYRQLLTHTSSVRDNWAIMETLYADDHDPTVSLADAMQSYLAAGGSRYDADGNYYTYAPGAMWNYSNIGVALAGHLVELHTGDDFADYCAAQIFAPLGLAHTSWRLADFPDRAALAMPYVWTGTAYEPAGHYTFADYPSGALRTSARDLARFLIALHAGQIVAPATVDEMFRAQVPALEAEQGLIWFRTTIDGADWVAHSGGELGVSTLVLLRPADGLAIVLLMNGEGDPYAPVEQIIDRLHDHAGQLP